MLGLHSRGQPAGESSFLDTDALFQEQALTSKPGTVWWGSAPDQSKRTQGTSQGGGVCMAVAEPSSWERRAVWKHSKT